MNRDYSSMPTDTLVGLVFDYINSQRIEAGVSTRNARAEELKETDPVLRDLMAQRTSASAARLAAWEQAFTAMQGGQRDWHQRTVPEADFRRVLINYLSSR